MRVLAVLLFLFFVRPLAADVIHVRGGPSITGVLVIEETRKAVRYRERDGATREVAQRMALQWGVIPVVHALPEMPNETLALAARLARETPGHLVSRLTNDIGAIQTAALASLCRRAVPPLVIRLMREFLG